MIGETDIIVRKLLPFLKSKKQEYEDLGVVPSLARLIKDLEKKV